MVDGEDRDDGENKRSYSALTVKRFRSFGEENSPVLAELIFFATYHVMSSLDSSAIVQEVNIALALNNAAVLDIAFLFVILSWFVVVYSKYLFLTLLGSKFFSARKILVKRALVCVVFVLPTLYEHDDVGLILGHGIVVMYIVAALYFVTVTSRWIAKLDSDQKHSNSSGCS